MDIFPRIEGYEIVSKLGEGAFGIVYQAKNLKLEGRLEAIKVFKTEVDEFVFFREVRDLSKVKHPGVVVLYSAGKTKNNQLYYSMELGDETLEEILKNKKLSVDEVINISSNLLDTIDYIHTKLSMVHGDLKPSNILRVGDYYKICDFGIVKIMGLDPYIKKSLQSSEGYVGTLLYSSPEQVYEKEMSFASDIYSMALVIREMLGLTPKEFESISKFNKEVSLELEEVIEKALSKNPKDRFSSALEFKNALIESSKKKTFFTDIKTNLKSLSDSGLEKVISSVNDLKNLLSGNSYKLQPGSYTINFDILIPKYCKLIIPAGTKINFGENGGIICEGSLEIKGEKNLEVIITAIDKENGWKNIYGKGKKCDILVDHAEISYGKGRRIEKSGCLFGGGFLIEGYFKIINSNVMFCSAQYGGGIFGTMGSEVILDENNLFDSCSAKHFGGGIYCDSESKVIINNNNVFNNCYAHWGGEGFMVVKIH